MRNLRRIKSLVERQVCSVEGLATMIRGRVSDRKALPLKAAVVISDSEGQTVRLTREMNRVPRWFSFLGLTGEVPWPYGRFSGY